MPNLVLASTSRYRAQLLERLRLPFSQRSPAVDESSSAGESPSDLAERLAVAKAQAVVTAIDDSQAVVLAADQTATLGEKLLRKPGDAATALAQLAACQGKSVFFYTAVSIVDCRNGEHRKHLDTTEVRFAVRKHADLARYVELERPFDCAGGFKAESLGIVLFDAIESTDPTALIGLPLIWVATALRGLGLDPLAA